MFLLSTDTGWLVYTHVLIFKPWTQSPKDPHSSSGLDFYLSHQILHPPVPPVGNRLSLVIRSCFGIRALGRAVFEDPGAYLHPLSQERLQLRGSPPFPQHWHHCTVHGRRSETPKAPLIQTQLHWSASANHRKSRSWSIVIPVPESPIHGSGGGIERS